MSGGPRFSWMEQCALRGTANDVDALVDALQPEVDIPTTKAADYYLGCVESEEGVARIEHYLFRGTQMQRNYCTLFFARRNDWDIVNRAFCLGLVDALQAYSR